MKCLGEHFIDHAVWLLGWLFPSNHKYKEVKKYEINISCKIFKQQWHFKYQNTTLGHRKGSKFKIEFPNSNPIDQMQTPDSFLIKMEVWCIGGTLHCSCLQHCFLLFYVNKRRNNPSTKCIFLSYTSVHSCTYSKSTIRQLMDFQHWTSGYM